MHAYITGETNNENYPTRAGTTLALTLSGCHDQNVKQESAPVASAAVGAVMCVTNAGSCPIFGTQESGSNCWCNHGYYVRSGYTQ